MKKTNPYKHIIHNRLEAIFALMHNSEDVQRLEKETALLALDIIDAVQAKNLNPKEGCQCFTAIEYALPQKMRKKLTEEFQDLVNEGIVFEEINTAYGPNINAMFELATNIILRNKKLAKAKALVEA